MQTSCIWAKIGQMSGGKSIDPCCVSEIFINARQKSNLGAQQRPIEQRCSAWLVHLQFAPKTVVFFWRFISILIPKTSCPKRIYVFFSCQVLVHLQLQSGQMKQTCGVIFFGTDVRPCFSSKMETRGRMCRICRIGGVCHPMSAFMRVDFPCQAREA